MTITDIIHNLETGAYTKAIQLNKGASEELIAETEHALQIKLPDDIKQFYRFSNGFESLDEDDCMFNIIKMEEMLITTLKITSIR